MKTFSDRATVVISHRVRTGREADYASWRAAINAAVARYDGFDGLEEIQPQAGAQDGWVIVFRFLTAEQLAAWLSSAERGALIDQAQDLLEDMHEQIVSTPDEAEEPQTIVISERVKPGREQDYRSWRDGITAAASRFPGYLGGERFPPVPGVQDEWVYMLRFATPAQLDGWLNSGERKRWRDKAKPLLDHVDIQRVAAGLGGWFPVTGTGSSGSGQQSPPNWKQALAVLLAMYPTVMLLSIFVAPLLGFAPEPADIFLRALANVAILTWLLMPAVNRLLRNWLYPPSATANAVGTLFVVTAFASMVALFSAFS
jgi:antibiotic biosynthesis monooxygenase (ABM) superfamily enzyme